MRFPFPRRCRFKGRRCPFFEFGREIIDRNEKGKIEEILEFFVFCSTYSEILIFSIMRCFVGFAEHDKILYFGKVKIFKKKTVFYTICEL